MADKNRNDMNNKSKLTKGEISRRKIIEAATESIALLGDRTTTFQVIADKCGVSQPLVVKYLKKRENIFPEVIKHILTKAVKWTEEKLENDPSPKNRIVNYIYVSYEIAYKIPHANRVFLEIHSQSSFNPVIKKINQDIKINARKRIAAIILDGVEQNEFKITACQAKLYATNIHNLLTGFLLSLITEDLEFTPLELLENLVNHVLSALLYSSK